MAPALDPAVRKDLRNLAIVAHVDHGKTTLVDALFRFTGALRAHQTLPERAMLIGSVLLVLIVELLNAGIESAIDRISLELHPLSKRAKDMGSAAVMLALVLLAVTWGLVLWPLLA